MAANRTEATKTAPEAVGGAAPAAAPAAGGGLQSWLPLIVSLVLMPVLAYVTTAFILVPKLTAARGGGAAKASSHEPAEHGSAHGKEEKDDHGGGKESGGGKGKYSAPLEKVLVNVAGSAGTRYLLAKFTLVSDQANLKAQVEKSSDQLRDLAASSLSSKTITDLEKPGSRNLIRSELISAFNSVLGEGAVREIYFTEFAIQ